jgi:hypothetical protein
MARSINGVFIHFLQRNISFSNKFISKSLQSQQKLFMLHLLKKKTVKMYIQSFFRYTSIKESKVQLLYTTVILELEANSSAFSHRNLEGCGYQQSLVLQI